MPKLEAVVRYKTPPPASAGSVAVVYSGTGGNGGGDGHDPVTLAATADELLDITGQQLSLDDQTAGKVLAAPAASTGAPTFRVLVASDLPSHTHDHATEITNVLPDQHHNRQHGIVSASDHTVTGNTLDLIGLSGASTLGVLVPSSDPGTAAAILRTASSGKLTLFDLAATQISSHLVPDLTDTRDLGTSTKLWRKGWLSELEAILFVENTITLLGGWFWVPKYAGTAAEDINTTETSIDLGASSSVMSVNDFIVFRQSLQVEYMQLTVYEGSNVWTVTRNLDGSGANNWPQGAPYACLGYNGTGRIELNAYDTPRIQLVRQGTAYNQQTELIRIGDLDGNWGYSSPTWGAAIGEYASGKANITVDQTGVFKMRTGTSQRIVLDAAGTLAISDGTSDVFTVDSGGAWLSVLAISEQTGEALFLTADGRALWGPGCAISPTSWFSTREQRMTLSGAFHQTKGRWTNTQALVIEEGTTNYIPNPVFGAWSAGVPVGWTSYQSPTLTQSTVYVQADAYSCRIQNPSSSAFRGIYDDITGLTTSESYRVSVWVYINGGTAYLSAYDGGGWNNPVSDNASAAGWHRLEVQKTATAGGIRVGLFMYTAGGDCYFDGVQLEHRTCATTVAWGGAGSGYSWSGTPHQSTSVRTATGGNLDGHWQLISGNADLTFRIVAQMPYAADGTWPRGSGHNYLMAAEGAAGSFIYITYDETNDRFAVSFNNSVGEVVSATQTFAAGDWMDLVVTMDYTADQYHLYINGVLAGSSTTSYSAQTLSYWNLGSNVSDAYRSGAAYSEFALFTTALTAGQVAALYALCRPLVDQGSVKAPGIYILDGRFKLASSSSGTRIELSASEIVGYNGATKQFYLQASDGKAYLGGGNIILDAGGIKGYDSGQVQRYYLKSDGSGWLGASDVFAWTSTGVVAFKAEGLIEPWGAPDLLNSVVITNRYGGGIRRWGFAADSGRMFTSTGTAEWLTGGPDCYDWKVTSHAGTYVEFNGSSDYLVTYDQVWQDPGNKTWVVWAWVRATSYPGGSNATILAKWRTYLENWRQWRLYWDNTAGAFAFAVSGDGSGETKVASTYTEATNTWYFVGAYYEPSTQLKIAVGSAADSSLTFTTNTTSIPASVYTGTTVEFLEGASNHTGQAYDFWAGQIGIHSGYQGTPATNINSYFTTVWQQTRGYYESL